MALENKLGITDSATLARTEEKLSKEKAVKLVEHGLTMIAADKGNHNIFKLLQRYTNIFLRISMISQGK